MSSPAVVTPVASDGPSCVRGPWSRASDSRFVWMAPSPSPAEVSELERLFPEIIHVPVHSLEHEVALWGQQAIIARSLARWVPPEAVLREFRRSGVQGEIDAISLAHKHYLFRFSDSNARDQILRKPLVVNGQLMAVTEWVPDFIPSEDTLLRALVWIRLPSLPIEFWTEEIVSSIISVAGDFCYLDEATKLRKRGGFARVCTRVDLSHSLRPGVRLQGIGLPFWQ